MFDRIGALGDRLLSMVVPAVHATASNCWYETSTLPTYGCIRRYCCAGGGIPGTQCGPYRRC